MNVLKSANARTSELKSFESRHNDSYYHIEYILEDTSHTDEYGIVESLQPRIIKILVYCQDIENEWIDITGQIKADFILELFDKISSFNETF